MTVLHTFCSWYIRRFETDVVKNLLLLPVLPIVLLLLVCYTAVAAFSFIWECGLVSVFTTVEWLCTSGRTWRELYIWHRDYKSPMDELWEEMLRKEQERASKRESEREGKSPG